MARTRAKGKITADYTVWCGQCVAWEHVGSEGARVGGERARLMGWKLTRAYGWLCARCRRRPDQNPKTRRKPRGEATRDAMNLTEARKILARSPEWVTRARCDNVEHWIRVYLDTARHAIVHPGEDPLQVAKEILHDLNREASAAGDEPYPLTPEELAAYLVVNTRLQPKRGGQ